MAAIFFASFRGHRPCIACLHPEGHCAREEERRRRLLLPAAWLIVEGKYLLQCGFLSVFLHFKDTADLLNDFTMLHDQPPAVCGTHHDRTNKLVWTALVEAVTVWCN